MHAHEDANDNAPAIREASAKHTVFTAIFLTTEFGCYGMNMARRPA
jgi:hypothetical protein